MDLTNSTVKTPEADTETPTRIQPIKPSAFTNGVLKRHAPHHHHHHPVVVTYKECLKNHAAAIGGHAVDGCGEFMSSPTSVPNDPTSLKCAACGCHRNFHRRESDETIHHLLPPTATPALEYHPHHRHHPPPPPPPADSGDSPNNSPSPPPISSAYYPSAPHMLLALSHSISAPPSTAATNANSTPIFNSSSGRKRFRTRFSQGQKEKMLELAERVGWKMQKRDEDTINEFCSKIGVEKGVFKVWMHNNKITLGRKDQINPQLPTGISTTISPPPPAASGNGNGISYSSTISYLEEGNLENKEIIHGQESNQHQHHGNGNGSHQVIGTNGSSSSS